MERFDDNYAMLLMYLADELSASDKAEVQRKLAADGGLRAELAEIQRAQAICYEALGGVDEQLPSSAKSTIDAEVARTGRLIRQWTTGRLVRPAAMMPVRGRDVSWRRYGIVAAACLVIASTIYWGQHRYARYLPNGEFGQPKEYANYQHRQFSPPEEGAPQTLPTIAQLPVAQVPDLAQSADTATDATDELPLDQQVELLDIVGSDGVGSTSSDESAAIASAPGSDDIDSIFLGLTSDTDLREGTR